MSGDDMFYCSFVSIHYIICECGETFPSEESLKRHLEKEHPHKKERKEFKCGVCNEVFTTKEACISHYEDAHIKEEPETETVDEDFLEETQDYVDYQQYPEITLQDQEFSGELQGENGEKEIFVLDESISDCSQMCEECGEVYLANQTHICLNGQSQQANDIVINTSKTAKCVQKTKIVCEVCGKKYATNAALRYHQRVHTGEKPYKCIYCTKSFTMPLFLQIHHRTHTGERPYRCHYIGCTKAFSNRAALLRHDRVHTGEKPFICPKCGKGFTQSNSMKLHVNTVHLKMPAPYKNKNKKTNKNKEADFMIKQEPNPDILYEDTAAVQTIIKPYFINGLSEASMQVLKSEDIFDQSEEIIYEDDAEKGIMYEIIYEE